MGWFSTGKSHFCSSDTIVTAPTNPTARATHHYRSQGALHPALAWTDVASWRVLLDHDLADAATRHVGLGDGARIELRRQGQQPRAELVRSALHAAFARTRVSGCKWMYKWMGPLRTAPVRVGERARKRYNAVASRMQAQGGGRQRSGLRGAGGDETPPLARVARARASTASPVVRCVKVALVAGLVTPPVPSRASHRQLAWMSAPGPPLSRRRTAARRRRRR